MTSPLEFNDVGKKENVWDEIFFSVSWSNDWVVSCQRLIAQAGGCSLSWERGIKFWVKIFLGQCHIIKVKPWSKQNVVIHFWISNFKVSFLFLSVVAKSRITLTLYLSVCPSDVTFSFSCTDQIVSFSKPRGLSSSENWRPGRIFFSCLRCGALLASWQASVALTDHYI